MGLHASGVEKVRDKSPGAFAGILHPFTLFPPSAALTLRSFPCAGNQDADHRADRAVGFHAGPRG